MPSAGPELSRASRAPAREGSGVPAAPEGRGGAGAARGTDGAAGAADLPPRKQDAERTRSEILLAARDEFARNGLSGARVDAIAARTRTSKRMIYYYFGSKEGLYLAVLEQAYGDIRRAERALDLGALPPREAMRRLVEFTFDYQQAHPEFIRLVSIENIHHARYVRQSDAIRRLNATAIEVLREILERGEREGAFRREVDPLDVHVMISAFCFFRVSNRHTVRALFRVDLVSDALGPRHKRMVGEAVLGFLDPARTP